MDQSDQLLQPDLPDEDAILTCCALRFDGYQYAETYEFQPEQPIEQFLKTGHWLGSETELLATFFHLQRALFKWSLVYEPQNGPHWRAFRELFLRLYEAEIPESYRMADYYDEWEEKFQPQLTRCVAVVRKSHENTDYSD